MIGMDRNENGPVLENSDPNPPFADGDEGSSLSCNFFLDHVGEVVLTCNSQGLSWKMVGFLHNEGNILSCLGSKNAPKVEMEVNIADVYAVDFINWGSMHESSLTSTGGSLLAHCHEMYRFAVHAVNKSKTQSSIWSPFVYTFGHQNLEICKTWVNQINFYLNLEAKRPKSLLVFVHPKSGKGLGCRIWEAVAPLFSKAKVKTKVMVTERAGHARDVLSSITNKELMSYDGAVAVGGDGFFSEILNGILLSRHKAPYPSAPEGFMQPVESMQSVSVPNFDETFVEPQNCVEESPLLTSSDKDGRSTDGGTLMISSQCEQDPEFPFPNEMFRFGIIPAGSTDAIVICTTGARDPVTSALHIILGKRVHLDIAQVVRWKETRSSNEEPCVRYAASFAGYGFYGDVITESEKYRWMGPKRYDYAGTKVFLQHRSYEAEVNYIEVESENGSTSPPIETDADVISRWCFPRKPGRLSCRANCAVCNSITDDMTVGPPSLAPNIQGQKWATCKGRFLSVGAAIISCRNEKAPDGLVADAHLSDGYLHLILVKDCPHPFYLWHLIQLARRGGDPLDFNFVEHHKTPVFTFMSSGKEGVWNVDGELFVAHQLSAQVFRGLVSMFAAGPES